MQQGLGLDLPKQTDTILWCVAVGAGVVVLYEMYPLVSGLRRLPARPNRVANEPMGEEADDLREKLLAEIATGA